MDDKKFIRTISLTLICYLLYFTATVVNSNVWGDILSPVLGLNATILVVKYGITCINNKEKARRDIWISYGLALISWLVADFLWAVYDLIFRINPEESAIITWSYHFTNIFIFIGVLRFIIALIKKWNTLQFILDTVCVTISILFTFWIIFFNKNIVMINIINTNGLLSVLSIIIDLLIFVGVAIWYLSVRKGYIPIYFRVSAIGITLYVCSDLYYYYIDFYDKYQPNSVIDAFYMGALLLIAFSSIMERRNRFQFDTEMNQEMGSNIGLQKKSLLLMICPILAITFEGFSLYDLLIFLILIFLHQILSISIQDVIKNKSLLQSEKENNLLLEEKIRIRTEEIQHKNDELQQKNKELNFLSNQDTITNLYNRRFFIKYLEKSIKNCPSDEVIGLLYLDLDRFKVINDMYGHQVGDEVLLKISKRLGDLASQNTILARLGGDEFVFCCKGKLDYKDLEEKANKIISTCNKVIEIEPYVFFVTVSIGISIYPIDAADANFLMRNADIAMYQAKNQGKNQHVSFHSGFREAINRKNDIEMILKVSNYNKEFELYYQPQFRIADKKLIGAEALLRWTNSTLGSISPAEFIPIAEEINTINDIGIWVFEHVVQQLKEWSEKYVIDFKIGVNVSPKQLDHKTIISDLKNIIDKYSVSPDLIDIEITESIAIEGESRIYQIDSLFKGLGTSISVDDFGTGYSSLSYLKFFPFERIKIAKQLVDSIATDNYDLEIVKAIIQLAKSIGMKTIAEGVETQEQFDILKELDCDEMQGYYLGRPVPVDQFVKNFMKNAVEVISDH